VPAKAFHKTQQSKVDRQTLFTVRHTLINLL